MRITVAALGAILLSNIGLAQTGLQQPVLETVIYGVTSSWVGECSPGVVNNQSQISRQNFYSSVGVTAGSGSWSVALNFSDVSCTGPWTTFGSASQITQASNPPIAYGNGVHSFIQIAITGNAVVTYTAMRTPFLSSSVGSVAFPLTIPQGGSGQTTAAAALQAFLAGSNQGTITNKVQMASTNSNVAGAPLCDTSDGSTTTVGCAPLLPTGSQNQFLRISPNTGNTTTYGFASQPNAVSASYNYVSILPSSPATLTGGAGSQTITIPVCPLGIYNSSGAFWAPIEISGGTGTAEAVTPSGGTCSTATQGIQGGTVIVAPLNNHSGAWGLSSATGGVAESVGIGASSIYIPSAMPATFHAAVVIPGSLNVSFVGDAFRTAAIIRASDYVSGDLFYAPGATNYSQSSNLSFADLAITNGPGAAGRAIHVVWGTVKIQSVFCTDGIFVDHDTTQLSFIDNFFYFTGGSPTEAIIYRATAGISAGNTNIASTNSYLSNGTLYMGSSTLYGVQINGQDSMAINNVTFVGMAVGLFMFPDTASYIAGIRTENSFFDAGSASTGALVGAQLMGRVGSAFGDIWFTGDIFGGESNLNSLFGLLVSSAAAGAPIDNITVDSCQFEGWGQAGAELLQLTGAGGQRMLVSNSIFHNNNVASHGSNAGGLYLVNPQGLTLTGNSFDINTGYGVVWTGVAQSGAVQINGGSAFGNSVGGIFLDNPLQPGSTVVNVHGVTDGLPAVASAGTFVFPQLAPNFTITGTTNMTAATLTGVTPNSGGTLRCTGGSPTVTSGSGWGNSFTCTSGALFTWFNDGTAVWVK